MNVTSLARSLWNRTTRKPKTTTRPRKTQLAVESLEDRRVMSVSPVALGSGKEIFVAPAGDDWNDGSLVHPFQTVRRALDSAAPGDTITLRNGVYQGGINVDIDALTIRSMPGEWAVVDAPLTAPQDGLAGSVFKYAFNVHGGKLENLEISGGYWYGVMMGDWWDSNTGPGTTHVGASGVTIQGCKIHDTGVDAVKITPGADDIAVIDNEIFGTGRRSKTSSDGIDNNNGDRMIARGNYVHDVAGTGILTSGGSIDSVIEQNFMKDVAGAGINVGFYSELEWMEPDVNPGLFASINNVARNNVVVNAAQAGIGVYSSFSPQVYNNTIVNPATVAQAPIQFGAMDVWVSDAQPETHVPSFNPVVENNVITTASDTRMVDVRENSVSGPLTLDYNLYHTTSQFGPRFIDRNILGDAAPERYLSKWQSLNGYDQHSLIADPQLDANYHLTATSPAIAKAIPLAGLTDDIDGNPRQIDPPNPDLGADQFGNGPEKALPPAAFGAPFVQIADAAYHAFEGNTITVRVVRGGQTTDTVTVQYATLDGTAKAGTDFTGVSGVLTFAPGETVKLVQIALATDSLPEGDEHFLFTLSNVTTNGTLPARLGHQSSASMTIDDADTPPIVSYRTLWVAPDGSDVTGDGSEAHPWHSLQFAADNVGPGDYVIVKPGQYDGMYVTHDGKADARITFHAMPGVEINDPEPVLHQDGINLEGADFVTVEGFYVHDMPRAGIRSVLNDGAVIRDNVSDHNGIWGLLTGWSEHLLVENNVFSRSQEQHGAYISNSSDDGIIRNNVVWGNYDSGIQFNGDGSLPGDGVHSRNVIEGNVIYDNGIHGGAAINLDAFQDGVVRNNLVYGNHSTGIVLYVQYGAQPSTNNLIENNTVYGAADSRYALLMWNGSSGNTIVNNVLLSNNPARGSVTVESTSLPAYSDHNVLGGKFELDGYTRTFADYQQFTGGKDAHSIFAAGTDLFADPPGENFHLKPGSPALDAGDPAYTPAVDVYQHARPQGGAVDIGAFEAGTFTPSVQFGGLNFIGYEMTGQGEVTVTRTGSTEGTLTVDYATTGGTATPGSDYKPATGQLVFLPGETTKRFLVFVGDDAGIEGVETVGLQLSNPTLDGVANPALLGQSTATLNLVSDDSYRPGRIEFDKSSVTVDESAGTATLTIRRVDGSSGPVTVSYSTGAYVPGRVPTWYSFHTLPLYPVDNATPATAGDDYLSASGVVNFADGETEKTITVPVVDDRWYESDEAFVVNLSNPGGGAALGGQVQEKVRIHSDDAKQPGQFTFSSPTYSVTEGTPSLTVTVKRVNGDNVDADVRLYDTGAGSGSVGSAWAGSDYGYLPGVLHFARGETEKTVTIPITDDTQTEGDEAFTIQLYSPSNDATIGDVAKTTVTIHDNESTFYFSSPNGSSYSVDEGAGSVPVKVVRSGALNTPASVRVKTTEWGSAQGGLDFLGVDVTLQFAPGEAYKIVNVPVVNDTVQEPQESFGVSMSNVVGAQQGSWTWTVNVNDDDQAVQSGKFSFSAPKYEVLEGVGTVTLTVNRTDGSAGTVSVKYATSDGASGENTAYNGYNYTGGNGMLTFAPGETSKTITFAVTDNTSVNPDKAFTVTLSNPTGGAILGATKSAVVKIYNDDSTIEFAGSQYAGNEGDGYVTVTLVRNGYAAGTASVDLGISTWDNSQWSRFEKPPTVTFAPGETTKQVQLKVKDDAIHQGDAGFNLRLTNVQGSQLGYLYWSSVTLHDND